MNGGGGAAGSETNTLSSSSVAANTDESPLGQALQIVDKKVRNLEKRKGKLDGYRADYQRGKTLNDDQKAAIAKYDEVSQNLDFARELSGQFKTLALEDEKTRKKVLKKEAQERAKNDCLKIASILEIQDLLKALGNFKTRADFVNGNHGAVKIAKEQMDMVKEFENLVRPARKNFAQGEDYEKALTAAAEHLSNLVDGKSKKVLKTSYKELKTLFNTIKTCGYFEGKAMKDSENVEEELVSSSCSEEGDRIPTEVSKASKADKHGKQPMTNGKGGMEKDHARGNKAGIVNGEINKAKGNHAAKGIQANNEANTKAQEQQPMPNSQTQPPKQPRGPKTIPVRDMPQEVQEEQQEHPHQQQPQHHQHHHQQHQQQEQPAPVTQMIPPQQQQQQQQPQPQPLVQQKPSHPPHQLPTNLPPIPAKPEIDFLQESQIGLDSPHMDPAVVVVQHSAPEGGPMNLHHPTPLMMTPTTLAAIQQHQHALSQMHHHHMMQQHYNQQQQQHQLENMVKKPAPGFAERPHPGPPMTDPEQTMKHHEPLQKSPMLDNEIPTAPAPTPIAEPSSEPAPVAAPTTAPMTATAAPAAAPVASGYAAIAAGSNKAGSQEPVVDTMSNIADWNSEVNNQDDRDAPRPEGYRGRGGRGGRGGDRGDRRPYRGGRGYGSDRGGDRGGRGTGERRGGGYGDRGSGYRGSRGGERGGRGGERGDRGSYRGREDRGERGYRGGGGFRGGRGGERGGGEHGAQRGQNGF